MAIPTNGRSAAPDTPALQDRPPSAPRRMDQEQRKLLQAWTQNLHFPAAAQPEIIRADQKDDYLTQLVQDRIEPLVRTFKGSRWTNQHSSELQETSKLVYLLLTTLPGSQTLGEEYCDVLKLDAFSNDYPTICRRALFIFVQVFSPRILSKLCTHTHDHVMRWNDRTTSSEANDEANDENANNSRSVTSVSYAYKRLNSLKKRLFSKLGYLFINLDRTTAINTLNALHLSLFYLTGRYFKWTARFTGMTYISNRARPLRPDGLGRVTPPSYEILGVLMMIQLVVSMLSKYQEDQQRRFQQQLGTETEEQRRHKSNKLKNLPNKHHKRVIPTVDGRLIDEMGIEPDDDTQDDQMFLEEPLDPSLLDQSSHRCTLCLATRKQQTSLECGHLFCWKCIVMWIKEKPECPLCRHSVRITDLLPLCNF